MQRLHLFSILVWWKFIPIHFNVKKIIFYRTLKIGYMLLLFCTYLFLFILLVYLKEQVRWNLPAINDTQKKNMFKYSNVGWCGIIKKLVYVLWITLGMVRFSDQFYCYMAVKHILSLSLHLIFSNSVNCIETLRRT